jgi:hypothetical protein
VDLSPSDWLSIVALGAGALMGILGKRTVAALGVSLIVVGVIGLAYSHFHKTAAAQSGGNCNNYGPNGTIMGSCNTTIVSPPHDASGLYQGDVKVGKTQGPTIDESSGFVSFQALVFNEFHDPTI